MKVAPTAGASLSPSGRMEKGDGDRGRDSGSPPWGCSNPKLQIPTAAGRGLPKLHQNLVSRIKISEVRRSLGRPIRQEAPHSGEGGTTACESWMKGVQGT